MKPHKHAELIKQWADGAEIEVYNYVDEIWEIEFPVEWNPNAEYRIKQELKPDVVYFYSFRSPQDIGNRTTTNYGECNLKLTFDGETGELKSAEVLK